MEAEGVRVERRGRKRKVKDVPSVVVQGEGRRQAVETRSRALVGQYVKKKCEDSEVLFGKVMFYDRGFYKIHYETGVCEELGGSELRRYLVGDDNFDEELVFKRNKLDEIVLKKYAKGDDVKVGTAVELTKDVGGGETLSITKLSSSGGASVKKGIQVGIADADSSCDSCEFARGGAFRFDAEASVVSPPELPPSSSNLSVPDECVAGLLSTYSFLRSFSIRLFLSPFELEDFVESLKCLEKNSLLDAIHVALMLALRRNFLSLSSNGSELASKLLRSMDWSLIDALTWPTFLVQYLLMMGYTDKHEMEVFYVDILQRDYYYLSVGRKLAILQILCDDALDCEELRVEIDMRGGHEFGIDCEATIAASENGPRRVHTRYLKTSPCKDQGAMGIIAGSCATKSFRNSISLEDKSTTTHADADVHNVNGDECRLCGMDGTLLCCDGCPSVYHSRCIGVIRMNIPHGKWYCPECTINNIGPSTTVYTSLRGGELFGVDPYEQVFMGTCNHLMVLKMSVTSETCIRYYHQKDIPRVLQALYSSPHHINSYSGLCNAIIKYWRIPLDVTFFDEKVELDTKLASEKEDNLCPTQSLALLGKSNSHDFLDLVESEKFTSCVTESSSGNMTISCLGCICDEPGINKACLDTLTQSKHHVCQLVNNDYATEQAYSLRNASSSEKIKLEPTMSSSSVSQKNDPTKSIQQEFGLKSELRGFASYTSGNSDSGNRVHVNHSCGAANMSSQGKLDNCPVRERDYKDLRSSLKARSYINNYINGDFAASAAANLAMLSSGENSDSKLNALDNYRKVMLLQIKAFSSAVSRFFWPNSHKKLVEVPRERCGWCLSCKAPVQSKKVCLLNASALNVTRGTMRTLADIRPVKNKEGSLYTIAAYVMFMEKSLCGLTAGPFQSQTYRKRWRKRVEQSLTCSEIKNLLLELEENIRTVAFSGDWFKLVDGWSTEPSVTYSTSTSSQKREPGRKRGRKQSVIPEVTDDDKRGISKSFIWWRGGILSKLIFQKGILPRTITKQSARQGGCRKITNIYYGEGVQVPKRNRRFAWKAAVELSKNTSQLALQIRYLDTHVRWGDLVHPEQTPLDGKGTDTEVHAFRNAVICQKQNVENKTKYAVSFGSQKHLPSRVLKNVLEVEKSEEGFEKYWFLETRVPLYMIKDYEESMTKLSLPPAEKPVNVSSKLHIRQLQASRKDIFSYLSRRRDKLDMCRCAYCKMDVFLGNAVNCRTCKGYCHVQCTVSSTVQVVEGFECLIACKSCHQTEAFMQNENKAIISSPVLLQKQEPESAIIISRAGKRNGRKRHRASNGASDSSSVSSKEVNKRNWGLVWKKENKVGGIDFRLNHILLKGNQNAVEIECYLCNKPYNPDLMYIHCGTCKRWYHADAVELEESRILELLGFKCFKCRKTKSPDCPYVDQVKKVVLEGQNLRKTPPKQASLAVDLSAKSFDVQFKATECATTMLSVKEESVCLKGDDPSVSYLLGVEHVADPTTEVEPKWNCVCQELSVKRQAKQGNCITCSSVNNPRADSSTLLVGNTFHAADETSSHSVEWNVPTNVSEDCLMVDSDDMEFEPQILLVSDHVGVELGGVDKLGAKIEYSENSSIILLEGDQPKQTDSLPEAVHVMPCRICYSKEPSPDRCCEICGIWMHSHCSPLSEGSSGNLSWRCSNCREWQ